MKANGASIRAKGNFKLLNPGGNLQHCKFPRRNSILGPQKKDYDGKICCWFNAIRKKISNKNAEHLRPRANVVFGAAIARIYVQ